MNNVNRYTFLSLLFHAAFFAAMFIYSQKIAHQTDLNKDFNMKLVQASVRVDVVAMPKMTFKELRDMETLPPVEEAAPAAQKEEAKDIGGAEDKVFEKETKKVSFTDLISKYNKPKVEDKKKNTKENANGINDRIKNSLKQLVISGNKLKSGTALTGSKGGIGEEAGAYLGSLPEHVRPLWKLPSFLLSKDLKCRIRVFLSANGKVLNAVVLESSGDSEYDKRSLDAVRASSPFPKLPPELVASGTKGEIVLGFPL